jgi:TolB-like protein/DNA-binding winged helix-turn-helix (wHTH) protein/Tfp pilus assembly protein PilF
MPVAHSSRKVRSGLFEIDFSKARIFRNGREIPIQEQPFRVLEILIEHPGELVSRDSLRARLWPSDTYVSFDEGLNTAVRKLRIVFRDSADNPRFIQTVPRQGYRFIAPVTEIVEHAEPQKPGDSPPIEVETQAAVDALTAVTGQETLPAKPETLRAKRGRGFIQWVGAAAVAIMVLGGILYELRERSRQVLQDHPRSMLVVLPFQNLSGDPAQEYFSDGLTEETITDLGQLSPAHLGVIARTSSMAYKHTDQTIEQIGRELNVNYVLEGSVRRETGRVRISAQLIRVSDQTHLWAQSYDARNLGDLIDVQSAIGRAIAEQVQVQVAPQYQADSAQLHAQNPAAYDLYLQGRFYWNQRTSPALRKSIEFFKQAIAADPSFPQAYAGLADAYNIGSIIGALSSKESAPQAREAATRALELDPSLADAHAALAMEKSHYEFDLPGARAEFQKAIELNPNSAYAHLFYSGGYLMPMGLRIEAIAEMKKAVELDPLSLPINNFLGETYVLAGDYPAAYRQYQHTIAMNPNFPLVHAYMADLLELMGRFDEAIREREKAALLSGESEPESAKKADRLTKALKSGGVAGFWKEQLAQDLRASQKSSAGFDVIAQDYAQAGEKDLAFQWLEKSMEAREGQELTLLAVDPMWNNLHGDPRFSNLLRRIGLPDVVPVQHQN